MTKADAQTFLERLAGLSELFNAKLSPAVQQIYFNALKDLELSAVMEAMNATVCSSRFMPKPAELREMICGGTEDKAEQAWIGWRAAARQVGSYSSILTDDPALAETLMAVFGGWPQACGVSLSDEMWAAKRKEFGRVYRVMANRGLTGERYLAGTIEAGNAAFPERPHPLAQISEGKVIKLGPADIEVMKLLAASERRSELAS